MHRSDLKERNIGDYYWVKIRGMLFIASPVSRYDVENSYVWNIFNSGNIEQTNCFYIDEVMSEIKRPYVIQNNLQKQ